VLTGFTDYIGGANYHEKLLRLMEGFVKVPESNIREKVLSPLFLLKS